MIDRIWFCCTQNHITVFKQCLLHVISIHVLDKKVYLLQMILMN